MISSPHRFHFEHAKAALERGLHVMVEKPMALHGADAWELVAAARERELHLLVPYGWNYKTFVEEAQRRVVAHRAGPRRAAAHRAS